MTCRIQRVAVLGAGTMGGAIAAHCANAGLDVDLLDIAADELTEEEEKKGLTLYSPEVRNRIVTQAFEQVKNARPPAFMSDRVAERIRLGNLEDDLRRVAEVDWILEAIIEKLEPKQDLMAQVEEHAKSDAIISTNTSGIPLHNISEGRSEGFKRRFLGTHFFNPPRYLKLLEIIPTEETDPELVEEVQALGERVLGKGVVLAKDTPNFIGNRLGTFSMMNVMRYAFENGYGIEELDAITGPLIGRPKTATFRLQDQVGLDISVGVAENLYEEVTDDESREQLRPPEKLNEMREQNLLDAKSGSGFYKREERDGEKVFDVLNLETMEDVDHAMEWGYGHEAGPFRMWDLLGVKETVEQMEALGIEVADWVKEMLEEGDESFYKMEGTQELQFGPIEGDYVPVRED